MKQHVVRIAIGMAIALLFIMHAAEKYPAREPDGWHLSGKLAFVAQLDDIIYDTRLKLTMPAGPLPKGPDGIVSFSRVS